MLLVLDDIYQNAHFNELETNEKDGGQFSPHIFLRETRAYPHEKGEYDKQGEIPPLIMILLLVHPSYTLTSPFNTQRVINTVKTKTT